MIIYIDIIFLENFIITYLILNATSIISKTKITNTRFFISSFIGAIYTIIMFLFDFKIYSNIVLKFILSIIIVEFSFKPENIKLLTKYLALFYLTTFTFGGVVFYLIYVLKPQDLVIKNGTFVGTYVLKVVFIGAVLGTGILVLACSLIKNKIKRNDIIYNLRIIFNNESIKIKAMMDTGNFLREPITGLPVIIIEKNKLYSFIPQEILTNLNNVLVGDLKCVSEEIKEKYITKIKFIPYSSLGKTNGLLIGFKFNNIKIINEETKKQNENFIIGIYDNDFTKNDEYNALFGIEFF